jgi:hypothetical protein
LHPIKKAVCEEILGMLSNSDYTVRKETINSLRKPRYFFSRTERAQIDYFVDKNEEWLNKLITRLCQLITDISPEVQKATLLTLAVIKKYPGVNKIIKKRREEIISSTTNLLMEDNLKPEVLIHAAKLLSLYKAVESKMILEEAFNKFLNNDQADTKVSKAVSKSLKSLQ